MSDNAFRKQVFIDRMVEGFASGDSLPKLDLKTRAYIQKRIDDCSILRAYPEAFFDSYILKRKKAVLKFKYFKEMMHEVCPVSIFKGLRGGLFLLETLLNWESCSLL